MEAYPPEYIEHNLPLILISGLGERQDRSRSTPGAPRQESGTRIHASLPECDGDIAQQLLQQLLQSDGSSQLETGSTLPGLSGALKYSMKAVGRSYTLPPRKAAPMPQPTSPEGFQNHHGSPPRGIELHSPLSPLSPGSPIFPDGVFTPLWFTKHQQQVPSLFVAFFNISARGDGSQDEQLKTNINAIRTSLNRSGFKTRFATVLISDRSILQAPELEERLSSIRRLTSLDAKTGLFFMPPMSSSAEIATFVQGVLTTLQPLCVEYYRDLTKHARRKKTKGGAASSVSLSGAGSSQSLSTPGWNARYEVKQGVFAEFRQEIDVAERHYSAAIDDLFNSEGVLEATSTWSPRWNEARLFCDSIALRVLRCLLWTSQTNGAAQFWVKYKARMKGLVDRRGKGSQTYGWEAWEARWAEIMSQLIQQANLPSLQQSTTLPEESVERSPQQIYAAPEKTFTSMERTPPFQYLHHSGYWLRLAVKSARARRKKALVIPEEDRIPIQESTAAVVAGRTTNYDCYLVPKPHEEYGHDPISYFGQLVDQSIEQFQGRSQVRMTELMTLDLAQDLVNADRYGEAIQILLPLWGDAKWRDEGWYDILVELLMTLRQCAEKQRDSELLLGTTYELLSIQLPLPSELTLDLDHCLDDQQSTTSTLLSLSYGDRQRLCPVAISFAFDGKETHVGEPVGCQLTLSSHANDRSAPISLTSVTLSFGPSKVVKIVHAPDGTDVEMCLVNFFKAVEAPDGPLESTAYLTLRPAQRRILDFRMTFRDAEPVRLTQATIMISADRFHIQHTFTDDTPLQSDFIFAQTEKTLERKYLRHDESTVLTVLPKPPKVRVLLHERRKQYYTDELIRLKVEIVNEEVDAIDGKISTQMEGGFDADLRLQWTEDAAPEKIPNGSLQSSETPVVKAITALQPGTSQKAELLMWAPSEPCQTTVSIQVDYSLSGSDGTPLQRILTLELDFADPFEAKFNFGPLVYRDEWPSYFNADVQNTSEQPGGIPQLWRLSTELRSLAANGIVLHEIEVVVDSVAGDSQATAEKAGPKEERKFEPGQTLHDSFQLYSQKYSLNDRRPTTIESTLAVTWSHEHESERFTTRIPVSRLILPVSEPRVLCTLAEDKPASVDAVLEYHIENPSTHFLTFAVTMEASEDFGFSGAKHRTLSLAPLSRHRLEYRITLQDPEDTSASESRWIWPSLQVIDSYYQKTLRVHPGGTNVKLDEKQNIGVRVETSRV